MARARLISQRAAMRRSSVWGAAEACSPTDGLRLSDFDMSKSARPLISGEVSRPFEAHADRGGLRVSGSLGAHMRYEGLELPLALCLGAVPDPPLSMGMGRIGVSRSFYPVGSISGLFATLALDTGMDVLECPSLKVAGFVIRGRLGGALSISLRCIADTLRSDSEVNTPLGLASLLPPDTGPRVFFSDGLFSMNDELGGELGDADTILPSYFEFGFMRHLSGEAGLGSASETADEPGNIKEPEAWLRLGFPGYLDGPDIDALGGGARMKAQLSFEGPFIEEGIPYRFTLRLPSLARTSVEMKRDGDVITWQLTFNCLSPEAPPAGMGSLNTPLHMELVNILKGDVLG